MRARLLALSIVAMASCKNAEERPTIKVAAASDLALAFPEVGRAFTDKTGTAVVFSFGSTGLLAKQISEGAPFDVFAAANKSFVDDVVSAGACDGGSIAEYAVGRIAIWVKGKAAPKSLAELAGPEYAKIAVANPEHAPYGKAAVAAIEKAGVADSVKPKLVYGENIQQTLQYAQSGNADAAIIALSLASHTDGGAYVLLDDALHPPIDQAIVACGRSKIAEGASAFVAFVRSPEGHAIMRRYGFLLPGESIAMAN
jgi:molybdate transport system substrate-binding protein